MGLQKEVGIQEVCNEIAMCINSDVINLVLEGYTDANLFEGFVDDDKCNIYVLNEKKNVKQLMESLETIDKYQKTVAIIDDDHDELLGNGRPTNTFRTDTNDIETMILQSESFYIIARNLFPIGDCPDKSSIDVIRNEILDKAIKIGEVRLADRRNGWNLRYKGLKFNNVFKRKDMSYMGEETLIKVLKNHSQRLDLDSDMVYGEITKIHAENHEPYKIVVGHDVTHVIELALEQHWHRRESEGMTAANIEVVFRTTYRKSDFVKTKLYNDIVNATRHHNIQFI